MKNLKQITLINGATLYLTEGLVTCVDSANHRHSFTSGQQKLLWKLAENLDCPVSTAALYEAYAGSGPQIDGRGIRDNVAKLKNTLPDCVKSAIKSMRGYGYLLMGMPEQSTALPAAGSDSPVPLRAEEYFGYFLNPVGDGSVLGAYLHIKNRGSQQAPQLYAYAVFAVRSDAVLYGQDIVEIFSESGNYGQQFEAFKDKCSDNDRRCFWGEGQVQLNNTVAHISFSTPTNAKWELILEMGNYLSGGRKQYRGDAGKYRGGMGILIGVSTQFSTFACKLGLVHKSFVKPSLSLKNEELKKMLRISENNGWNPLMVEPREDNYWYNWFMSE